MNYPAWLDRAEYPFAAHTIEVDGGQMHYLDEGSGPVLLFVHGTPTWTFEYRHVIKRLSAGFRCIAPDHIGFGLSAKPAGWGYRPEDHARNLRLLIDRLELHDIIMIVHDFGGPIGLAYAIDRPENIAGLVVSNTWLWSLDSDWKTALPLRIMGGSLGRFLYRRFNFSPRVILPAAWANRVTLTDAVLRHYTGVHQTPTDREALHGLARAGLGSSAWYESLWQRRDRLREIPIFLLWGMRDPAFGAAYLARFRELFQDADARELQDIGHFVAEEAPAALAEAVMTLAARVRSVAGTTSRQG